MPRLCDLLHKMVWPCIRWFILTFRYLILNFFIRVGTKFD
ncbi:hypothetical protein D3OALGA1CA_1917 [Olavius algarvensis associated proteobacterium Delta 3]|nr:hypothetical protein D3OALGA1CA_1917 [Olavius algarvensis associated proteobacterium Delta 3]